MLDAGLLVDGLLGGSDSLETTALPTPRALRMQARRKFARLTKEDSLRNVLDGPPARNEQVHIVSASKFDFWTWIPVLLGWLGRTDHLYCSTWILSRANATELFELWDAGKIARRKVSFLTGIYFKRRESAVYAMLLDGLTRRGGRYRAIENHSKVLLLANRRQRTWLTIEGSANLTGNPRVEQYVITNDPALHDFHREWMDEMFER